MITWIEKMWMLQDPSPCYYATCNVHGSRCALLPFQLQLFTAEGAPMIDARWGTELTSPVDCMGQRRGANAGCACQVEAQSPTLVEFALYIEGFCHAPSWQQCANNSSHFSAAWCSPGTCLFCWETLSNVSAVGFWLFSFWPDDSHTSC